MDKSISDKQLAANRHNAMKSTGPKTDPGKAIVACNATKHGLLSQHVVIDDEDQAEFTQFRHQMLAEFAPVGFLEQNLADKVVASFWRLKRAGRIEVEVLNDITVSGSGKSNNDLPFTVIITKTYAGRPDEYVETPAAKVVPPKQEPEPEARLTLGQAVQADLAGANILIKLNRYEAHIDRVLYKALHELQRLQARRAGQQVDAPHIIDIDVSTDPPEKPD